MFIDDAGTTPDDAFVVGIFCTQVDGASRSVVQAALADVRSSHTPAKIRRRAPSSKPVFRAARILLGYA